MDLPYIMDTMFDLLNESDNLNVKELEENETDGVFLLTAGDGTRIVVTCKIVNQDHFPNK